MKGLFILLFSVVMAGEMTVDGNLTVTDTLIVNNRDVITTIDSLLSLIAQLEMRIAQLECQNTGIIPDGYCDCFFHTIDECGVCNGDTTTCQDCAGVPNGDNLQDMCGYCDNDSSNDCLQDCNGEWGGSAEVDQCGECGGEAESEDECSITDIDGNTYEIVIIGDQVWMAENLKTTHYKNGDAIQQGFVNDMTEGAYTDYDNDPSNSELYGKLYNWHALADTRGVCPAGSYVPSDVDWIILTDYLGGTDVAGGKMKSTGTIEDGDGLWYSPNEGASNESGFTGFPSGHLYGHPTASYVGMGTGGSIFSSTPYSESLGKYLSLNHNGTNANINLMMKDYGCMSIRCIKN